MCKKFNSCDGYLVSVYIIVKVVYMCINNSLCIMISFTQRCNTGVMQVYHTGVLFHYHIKHIIMNAAKIPDEVHDLSKKKIKF